MPAQGLRIAGALGFSRVLCVCHDDNIAAEKIILKNGGRYENSLYNEAEAVTVKRYWIEIPKPAGA